MTKINKTNKQSAEKSPKFETPSWNQVYRLVLKLAEKIKKSRFEPDVIVGVSRGGWIPARIVSDIIENSNLANVTTEFYEDIAETKQEPTITQPISVPVKDMKVLVVDDLADTGKSLKLVKAHLKEQGAKEIKIATIFYKPESITVPDFYEKKTKRWVVFPWEQKETIRKIVHKTVKDEKTVEDAKEKLISFGLNKKQVEQFTKEIAEEKR